MYVNSGTLVGLESRVFDEMAICEDTYDTVDPENPLSRNSFTQLQIVRRKSPTQGAISKEKIVAPVCIEDTETNRRDLTHNGETTKLQKHAAGMICENSDDMLTVKIFYGKRYDVRYSSELSNWRALTSSIDPSKRQHIVKFFDTCMFHLRDDTHSPALVMEYLPIILKGYLVTLSTLRFSVRLHYALQIMKAVEVLHDNGFVHLDIKPSNIGIVNHCVKLIDFDTVRRVDKYPKDPTFGTREYVAPEAHIRKSIETVDSVKADAWSVGCVLYWIFVGEPFVNKNALDKLLFCVSGAANAIELNSGMEWSIRSVRDKRCFHQAAYFYLKGLWGWDDALYKTEEDKAVGDCPRLLTECRSLWDDNGHGRRVVSGKFSDINELVSASQIGNPQVADGAINSTKTVIRLLLHFNFKNRVTIKEAVAHSPFAEFRYLQEDELNDPSLVTVAKTE